MIEVIAEVNMTCGGEPRKKGDKFKVSPSIAKQLVSTKLAKIVSEKAEQKTPNK